MAITDAIIANPLTKSTVLGFMFLLLLSVKSRSWLLTASLEFKGLMVEL